MSHLKRVEKSKRSKRQHNALIRLKKTTTRKQRRKERSKLRKTQNGKSLAEISHLLTAQLGTPTLTKISASLQMRKFLPATVQTQRHRPVPPQTASMTSTGL